MARMGTSVTNGYARGIVVATGMDTEFGRIARLTSEVERSQTPLQKRLAVLGKKLGILSVAISALVAIVGYLFGKDLLEMFLTGDVVLDKYGTGIHQQCYFRIAA